MLIKTAVPTPSSPAPVEAESFEELLMLAEQLQQQTEQLRQENSALQSQLSAMLAANHTPVLKLGAGTSQFALNARSIGSIYLAQERVPNSYPQQYNDRWIVMADTNCLTAYLDGKEAVQAYETTVADWIVALEPPTNQK